MVNVARPEKRLSELAQANASTSREYLETLFDALYSVLMEVLRYRDVLSRKVGEQSLESLMICLAEGAIEENLLTTI